jgi:hypothetical protein
MSKSLLALLVLSALPLAALGAVPMTMNEDSGSLPDPAMQAPAASSSPSADASNIGVDEPRESTLSQDDDGPAPVATATQSVAARAAAVRPDADKPANKRAPAAAKNHEGPRWQSLLPGVMQ